MGQKKRKGMSYLFKIEINKYTIADFQMKLSHKAWKPVFEGNDVNKIFNSFLHIFFKNLLF
jgi:hypothetical protein